MLSFSVASAIRTIADRYKSLFKDSPTSYRSLCALLSLSLYNCKGLSELARFAPWSPSVSELSRAVDGWNANRFMRRLRASVLRRWRERLNTADFCYAVDDTANPKFGKGIYARAPWHSSGGAYVGQKILVIALIERRSGVAIPIHYAFGIKKTEANYRSMPDLAIECLAECLACGFPPLPVTCDSWFDSSDFMKDLEKIGLSYDGEIKSTRNLRVTPGLRAKIQKLATFFQAQPRQAVLAKPYGQRRSIRKKRGPKKKKYIAETVAMINGITHPMKVIAVYNHRNDKEAFAYYVSTNRTMSGAELWALARSRWAIEVLFRDMKQNLAFGHLPCTGKEAADLAVCVPFALIVSLRLDKPVIWGLSEGDEDSIGTKLAKIKQAGLDKAINVLIFNPRHAIVERLRARRQTSRLNRKPVNKPAASQTSLETQATPELRTAA